MSDPRRWTATITYSPSDNFTFGVHGETVNADLSEEDLQRSQLYVAQLEAASYLLAGAAKAAYVQLYKTTKANGTVKDHSSDTMDIVDAERFARRHLSRKSYQYTPRAAA